MIRAKKQLSHPKSRRPRRDPGWRRNATFGAASMEVAEIVTVCIGRLLPELRDFLPSARVAFPRVPIWVYTDAPDEAIRAAYECRVGGVSVRRVEADFHPNLSRVARHADYWQANAIWYKLAALRERIGELPSGSRNGVLLADCDVVFRLGLERPMLGDVALSPFYWGRRSIRVEGGGLLQHRDGEFNAGMVLSRSEQFADWWMRAFLDGTGGFYEQGCLDLAPELFHCDYLSPLHNWGKWRFAPPPPEARSYHQHLAEPSRRGDVGAIQIAARRAAAEARAILSRR